MPNSRQRAQTLLDTLLPMIEDDPTLTTSTQRAEALHNTLISIAMISASFIIDNFLEDDQTLRTEMRNPKTGEVYSLTATHTIESPEETEQAIKTAIAKGYTVSAPADILIPTGPTDKDTIH